jgi:hypothetical protein
MKIKINPVGKNVPLVSNISIYLSTHLSMYKMEKEKVETYLLWKNYSFLGIRKTRKYFQQPKNKNKKGKRRG